MPIILIRKAERVKFKQYLPVVAVSLVLLSSLLFLPSFASSEIYKWTDREGNVVFSESPPSGANAEEVKVKDGMRVDRPASEGRNDSKGKKGKSAATGQKLRDVSDINVVMYMTDW